MNSDFSDLLKFFKSCKVRYLIVGGYAVMKYTEPRYTKDLDIWIEASAKNARGFQGIAGIRCAACKSDRSGFCEGRFFLPNGSASGAGGYPDVDRGRAVWRCLDRIRAGFCAKGTFYRVRRVGRSRPMPGIATACSCHDLSTTKAVDLQHLVSRGS